MAMRDLIDAESEIQKLQQERDDRTASWLACEALIARKNEAICKAANGWELMSKYRIKLREIAAMTTDDSPEHRDETDRRCNDAVIRCNDCGTAPRSFEWWCPKCGTWKEYGNISEEENASTPYHKCQNFADADTGECAVCGEDAPKEFGISQEDIDAILIPDDDAPPDALETDPLTGRPPDSEEWQRLNEMQQQIDALQINHGRMDAATDRIPELQQQIQRLFDAIGLSPTEPDYSTIDQLVGAMDEMQQQINSHTAIVHGEIERRLTELGQQINQLNSDDKMMAEGVNATGRAMQQQIDTLETKSDAMRLDIISPRQINPKLQRLQQQIDALEQRITPEGEVPENWEYRGD